MAYSIDPQNVAHLKRAKEFVVGWFGIFGGIGLFFFGLIGRHVTRYRAYEAISFEGKTFEYAWNMFAAGGADIPAFVMGVGRVIYFVSCVAALFTYEGTQIWNWLLISVGALMLVASGLGSMLKSSADAFAIAVTGGGVLLSLVGLYLVDVGKGVRLPKASVAAAIVIGGCSFPLGVYAAIRGYTFGVCLIAESFAFVCGLAGLLSFVHHRFTTPQIHVE